MAVKPRDGQETNEEATRSPPAPGLSLGLVLMDLLLLLPVLQRKEYETRNDYTKPVLLNVYGAPELIPRNEFRQPL